MDRQEIKAAVYEAIRDYFTANKTVTVSEAARMLDKTRKTITAMVRRGELQRNENGVLLQSIYNYAKN